jgi:RimJ/RimL family protein N-acetyltransferase
MIVEYHQFDPTAPAAPPPPLAPDLQMRWWEPERNGFPQGGSRRLSNYVWWALAKAGGFSRPGFGELRIERAGRVVNRLIVTPRWYRFPFMGPDDLQIGAVWTSPEARRQGLARIALAEAHRRIGQQSAQIWYVTDAANPASAALARASGYRHVAAGRRVRRFGTSLLARYVIDRFA